jgi:hypothetical protein
MPFSPSQMYGLSAGGAAFGAGLGNLFSNPKNPASAAQPYLNQIPGTLTPYYQPYINAGNSALNTLMPQYNNLVSNPGQQLNTIGQGYQQSPGYQFNVDQATKAANQAAAAGGMLGSPAEQQSLATTVTGLANQDYNNWMNQALGLYGTGLQGLGNINTMGYGASNELAQSLANNLMSQAQLAYAGQANQNQSKQGGWGSLIGGGASMLPFLFGGF